MAKILRTSYTAREKRRIIAYCKQNSLRNAQQKYGIHFAQISKWCKNESAISKAKSKNRHIGAGLKPLYPDVEELNKWIEILSSYKWLYDFMNCYNISIRKKTKIGQKLPRELSSNL
ncbi:13838_t:CDS:2 [Ambispora leptoticha]|uniref:13838_t:CDS:1 n=1 Tax=Ambispora leptoticha TaxID=144679 RepID=A0A9N9FFC0_9GLOM|nr:13838_t:CDS:2 [Ambispora leptoticha]